jgi:hypothetical protein
VVLEVLAMSAAVELEFDEHYRALVLDETHRRAASRALGRRRDARLMPRVGNVVGESLWESCTPKRTRVADRTIGCPPGIGEPRMAGRRPPADPAERASIDVANPVRMMRLDDGAVGGSVEMSKLHRWISH